MTPECVRQDNVYQTDFQFARFAEHCASDGVDCFCCSLGRTDLIEVLYTIFTAVASSCTSKILRFLDLICNKTLLQPVSDACIGLWDSANCGLTLRCAVSNGVLESGRNLNDRDGGITLTFHGGGHSGSLTDKANVTNDTNIDDESGQTLVSPMVHGSILERTCSRVIDLRSMATDASDCRRKVQCHWAGLRGVSWCGQP